MTTLSTARPDPVVAAPPRLELRTPAAIDVFTRILTHGPIGRIDITRQTGLSQAAVTKAVTPLIVEGFVVVDDEQQRGLAPGRPVYPLRVMPNSLLSIGVKVNADEVIGVATTMRAEIIHSVHLPVADTSVETIVTAVVSAVSSLRADLGDSAARVAGIGVSVSGDVDTRGGVVRDSALLGWHEVPLGRILADELQSPVLIENDVRALTIAEQWFGVGVDAGTFAIVTIGAGIGCGLYVNGDVVSGANGVAGEIGHLPLAPESYLCTCGRHGCVEAVASSGSILAAIRASEERPELSLQDAIDLAHAGNASAVAAFDRAGRVIGTAVAAMVNLVGPEIVLVAGESVANYDLYETRLREAFAEHAFGSAANARIVTTSHTFDDWARGAAAAVIRATVRGEQMVAA
ncbi:ROK family protein [Lacisediminihabitans changchengi]|uniref:ROK family protein n=1 Tax=Lacisediminihabitans changchengi TaxID=2787634 RepID=A0A934SIL7_9MICO|nr:ROK family protein [Lacisediminihabitans changchengi]MBK4346273.1 ROK family protein [Lacisediminihabitans changchengi]